MCRCKPLSDSLSSWLTRQVSRRQTNRHSALTVDHTTIAATKSHWLSWGWKLTMYTKLSVISVFSEGRLHWRLRAVPTDVRFRRTTDVLQNSRYYLLSYLLFVVRTWFVISIQAIGFLRSTLCSRCRQWRIVISRDLSFFHHLWSCWRRLASRVVLVMCTAVCNMQALAHSRSISFSIVEYTLPVESVVVFILLPDVTCSTHIVPSKQSLKVK